MNINENTRNVLFKVFGYIGCTVSILISFAFLLPATILKGIDKSTIGAKMISWMRGTNGTIVTSGMTTLLILQIIIAIAAIVLFILLSSKKTLNKRIYIVFSISMAIMLLVCVILSFNVKNITCTATYNYVKGKVSPEELETIVNKINHTHLGAGPILYSSLGLVGFLCLSACGVLRILKTKQ